MSLSCFYLFFIPEVFCFVIQILAEVWGPMAPFRPQESERGDRVGGQKRGYWTILGHKHWLNQQTAFMGPTSAVCVTNRSRYFSYGDPLDTHLRVSSGSVVGAWFVIEWRFIFSIFYIIVRSGQVRCWGLWNIGHKIIQTEKKRKKKKNPHLRYLEPLLG